MSSQHVLQPHSSCSCRQYPGNMKTTRPKPVKRLSCLMACTAPCFDVATAMATGPRSGCGALRNRCPRRGGRHGDTVRSCRAFTTGCPAVTPSRSVRHAGRPCHQPRLQTTPCPHYTSSGVGPVRYGLEWSLPNRPFRSCLDRVPVPS